jgi:hypothetical protein
MLATQLEILIKPMRFVFIFIVLILLVFNGCGIYNRIGESIAGAMIQVLPDSCELNLISDILRNREDSLKIPTLLLVPYQSNSTSDSVCNEKIDSIYTYRYNSDSIDIQFRKNLIVNGKPGYINKQYRINYRNDSIFVKWLNLHVKDKSQTSP